MHGGGAAAGQPDDILIGQVIYLASLATDPKAIDSQLDTLRSVTAIRQPGQPLEPEQQQRLLDLKWELEEHLLYRDPLRRFTPETLRQRVEAQGREANASGLRLGLGVTWFGALAAAGLVFLLPLPLLLRASIALPVFIIAMHAGGAWFYWSALHDLKTEIRRAYRYIVFGIILIGLTAIQFPFITSTRLGSEPFGLYGGTLPLFTYAIFLFYVAMRAIAIQLNIRSPFRSLRVVGAGTLVIAAAAVVVPHSAVQYEIFFDISLVSDLLVVFYCACAAVLAWKVSRAVTAPYARAVRFFSYTMIVAAINVTWYGACLVVFGELDIVRLMIAMAPHGFTEIMLMSSGYVFRKHVGR